MTRWVLIALLTSAPANAAGRNHVSLEAAGEKVALVNHLIFVNVFLNGHGPFRMMVDTGATSCAVTPEVAARAGLVPDERVIVGAVSGDKVVPAVSATRIRVGATESYGEVLIMSVNGVRTLDPTAAGTLGQSFLGQHPYLIDYRAQRLYLGDEATQRADLLPAAVQSETVSGRMVVPVQLSRNEQPWRLALDSGANSLVVQCGNRCPNLSNRTSTSRVVTNTGECRAMQGTLASVDVAGITIRQAEAALVETGAAGGAEDGMIPAHWFAAVYVDGARNQVRLRMR